ncbi:DNA repair and recombination protein RadB [Porphyridium purpureum]|uniref:DNA repair and recombination protein RadB n=1 Tax=Porphyridium purpureum TaxID=35688 RepID=A0A5J4Z9Q5_PORPP|nr:DNA repair and recombination protein RadB [Porphyridium purpureum]|eukprot:POR3689..scf295_1
MWSGSRERGKTYEVGGGGGETRLVAVWGWTDERMDGVGVGVGEQTARTGIGGVDEGLLRGGLCPGQLLELVGTPEGSGATQLACALVLHSAAQQGVQCVYVDTDGRALACIQSRLQQERRFREAADRIEVVRPAHDLELVACLLSVFDDQLHVSAAQARNSQQGTRSQQRKVVVIGPLSNWLSTSSWSDRRVLVNRIVRLYRVSVAHCAPHLGPSLVVISALASHIGTVLGTLWSDYATVVLRVKLEEHYAVADTASTFDSVSITLEKSLFQPGGLEQRVAVGAFGRMYEIEPGYVERKSAGERGNFRDWCDEGRSKADDRQG